MVEFSKKKKKKKLERKGEAQRLESTLFHAKTLKTLLTLVQRSNMPKCSCLGENDLFEQNGLGRACAVPHTTYAKSTICYPFSASIFCSLLIYLEACYHKEETQGIEINRLADTEKRA